MTAVLKSMGDTNFQSKEMNLNGADIASGKNIISEGEMCIINNSELSADIAAYFNFAQFKCYNSKIEAPDIYLPAQELTELYDCLLSGTVHYSDFE